MKKMRCNARKCYCEGKNKTKTKICHSFVTSGCYGNHNFSLYNLRSFTKYKTRNHYKNKKKLIKEIIKKEKNF